jgi:hypothetical protein
MSLANAEPAYPTAKAVKATKTAAKHDALSIKLEQLTALLSDSDSDFQTLEIQQLPDGNNVIVLALLMDAPNEGQFGYGQYLAVFETDKTHKDYSYVDCIMIGSKGWRFVDKLNAKIDRPKDKDHQNDLNIYIDAMENTEDDAPAFPTKKTTIQLILKFGEGPLGRLHEPKPR